MRYAHPNNAAQAASLSPEQYAALMAAGQGMPQVPIAQPAAMTSYSSVFQPSEIFKKIFGNRPSRCRVYSVRYSSVAGSAAGQSTNVNFQKGAIVKEMFAGSTNVTLTVGQTASPYGMFAFEMQLRYGNSDPIFTDYMRADALFGYNNERVFAFRPPLIILPQNTLSILLSNLLTTTVTTFNIGFLVEEPAY